MLRNLHEPYFKSLGQSKSNKGSAQERSNYRQIPLTSVLCKIMEKILFKHLDNFYV